MGCKPFTKQDFLDLWRRVLPNSYTEALAVEDSGLDVASSQAAQWARVEEAFNTSQQAYFLRQHSIQTGEPASGARQAATVLKVKRAAPTVGLVQLDAGTRFRAIGLDSFGAPYILGDYLSTEDVPFGEGVAGPLDVAVQAEFPGYTGNIRAGAINVFVDLGRADVRASIVAANRALEISDPTVLTDSFLQSLVGRYVRFSTSGPPLSSSSRAEPRRVVGLEEAGITRTITFEPDLEPADIGKVVTVEFEEWGDLGFTVSQPEPATGGCPDMLGAIGNDRRQARVRGESDEAYRTRLTALDDTISPGAIERICGRLLGPHGICFRLLETRDPETMVGFVLDLHPWDLPGPPLARYQKLDGSQLLGQGASLVPSVRYFAIGVARSNLGEFGFPFDATNPLTSCPNAWDVGFLDGAPIGFNALIGQLHEAVDQARAAGVRFDIFLDDSACEPLDLNTM